MLHRTVGIVLRSTPFGEADLIVTILSLDYGIIKVFAKSPRKTGSRFGSSLEPLTYSKISFWGKENKDLPRLTQSDIIKNFQSLREEVGFFMDLIKIIELTLRTIPERERHPDVFYLLLNTLNKIEGDRKILPLAQLFYTIRLLDLAGYGPRLSGCARCNNSSLNFYISQGSVICENCSSDSDHIRLTPQIIRVYETLRKWDISRLERIRLTGTLIRELSNILDAHILKAIYGEAHRW